MTFKYRNTEFDAYSAKSLQLYSLLIVNKAKYPNIFKTLSADLELSDPLHEVFSIPYNALGKTYVWSSQYKSLNNSYCTVYKQDFYHLFNDCSHARAFCKRFCDKWSTFQSENLNFSLKEVIIGLLNGND